MVDVHTGELSPEKILEMKMIKVKSFELDEFKVLCLGKMDLWKEQMIAGSNSTKLQARVESLINSVIAYACSQYMMSMSLYELQEKETLMYLVDMINDIVMSNEVNVKSTIELAIRKQRLTNESKKEIILTGDPDKNVIKKMNFKELRHQILEDAYNIVWRNWKSSRPSMTLSTMRFCIHNVFIIRNNDENEDYGLPALQKFIDNAGVDALFDMAEKHEFFNAIIGNTKSNKAKNEKKKDASRRDNIKTNSDFHIPANMYNLMSRNLILALKKNKGNASKIKKEQLSDAPTEVVEYVRNLPGGHHLSNWKGQ